MSYRTARLHLSATILTVIFLSFLCGGRTPLAQAAATSDQPGSAQKQHPAKPMIKKEPMAGGMKKDGMMKEDVSKAAQKWDAKMNESMKQETMK
jgi:hypothetical protein